MGEGEGGEGELSAPLFIRKLVLCGYDRELETL